MAGPNVPPNAAPDDWDGANEHADGTSPFGTGPVDPLVFVDDGTSPELRPAAQYVPIGPRLTLRPPAPAPKVKKAYVPWTPATPQTESPVEVRERRERNTVLRVTLRIVIALAVAAAPLLLFTYLIRSAMDLYGTADSAPPTASPEVVATASATPGATR